MRTKTFEERYKELGFNDDEIKKIRSRNINEFDRLYGQGSRRQISCLFRKGLRAVQIQTLTNKTVKFLRYWRDAGVFYLEEYKYNVNR